MRPTSPTARGLLISDGDAWNVLNAWYAGHLLDAALQFLVNNKVIKSEQRGDAGSILDSISSACCHRPDILKLLSVARHRSRATPEPSGAIVNQG
jgi:hypothetical protein